MASFGQCKCNANEPTEMLSDHLLREDTFGSAPILEIMVRDASLNLFYESAGLLTGSLRAGCKRARWQCERLGKSKTVTKYINTTLNGSEKGEWNANTNYIPLSHSSARGRVLLKMTLGIIQGVATGERLINLMSLLLERFEKPCHICLFYNLPLLGKRPQVFQ